MTLSSNRAAPPGDQIDEPFPLRRNFRLRFLPLFFLILIVVCVAAGFGAASIMRSIYLDVAERRAAVIDRAVSEALPKTWRSIVRAERPAEAMATPAGRELARYLVSESHELGLSHLKIYRADGTTLFSLDPAQIGVVEDNQLFRESLEGDKGSGRTVLPDGSAVYELYIPFRSDVAGMTLIFELYEPVGHLDTALIKAGLPAFATLALFLILLALGLDRLVSRAQGDIDGRTSMLIDFRARLERFISHSAVRAARESVDTSVLESRRIECTILFSDIRNFTGFSEQREPAEVVAFLNEIVGLQIGAITRHGGDVDKMIGDAVLALFEGAEKERRALDAAIEAQRAIIGGYFPRKVGIGVYSGQVVIGPVGPSSRMDFTVIGDSVNTAARLCTAANESEVVADLDTINASGLGTFGPPEDLSVKGRVATIKVARWKGVLEAT
ncbi:MAG: adenylate/guanylate cyclase domain-containing protein [Alphaproteobacteria bacterium]|nr:adenylate/guanylate cyclase domain-containing protein [Alphaproteobacteria bacterium]